MLGFFGGERRSGAEFPPAPAGSRMAAASEITRMGRRFARPDPAERAQRRVLLCLAEKNRLPGREMNARFRLFGAVLALCFSAAAPAQPIQVNNAGIEISETRYVLNADFRLDLGGQLLEALNNGVSLGFLVEFQV